MLGSLNSINIDNKITKENEIEKLVNRHFYINYLFVYKKMSFACKKIWGDYWNKYYRRFSNGQKGCLSFQFYLIPPFQKNIKGISVIENQ